VLGGKYPDLSYCLVIEREVVTGKLFHTTLLEVVVD